MARISQISYGDALAGRINRHPEYSPMGAWFVSQGATYSGSNRFVDADLTLGGDHFENVLMIIRSTRKQGHHGVEIRLTPESLSAVAARIAELSALEDVDIEARFHGEYLGNEQVIVTFRDRRADWLLSLASQELSADECVELSKLVALRTTRSEREVFLTEKVLTARRKRQSH